MCVSLIYPINRKLINNKFLFSGEMGYTGCRSAAMFSIGKQTPHPPLPWSPFSHWRRLMSPFPWKGARHENTMISIFKILIEVLLFNASAPPRGGANEPPVVYETSLRLLLWEVPRNEAEGLLIRRDFKQTIPHRLRRSSLYTKEPSILRLRRIKRLG